ncbi:hypothetical protein Hamer_G011680 [Homarus americanus]|uniref:Uncharacterized protein n=1 Tax=Homarus americanus TaxID=6706 RepID=A0A8J5K7Q8_HOMAM|nr:hypothetical protein Hamer_G011680 [Homarus americanus]
MKNVQLWRRRCALCACALRQEHTSEGSELHKAAHLGVRWAGGLRRVQEVCRSVACSPVSCEDLPAVTRAIVIIPRTAPPSSS